MPNMTNSRKEPGDSAVDGLFSGLIAGLIMAVILIIPGLLAGRSMIEMLGAFSVIGESDLLLGTITHLSVSAIYGALFGFMSGLLPGKVNRVVIGLVYGLALYVAASGIFIPEVNRKLEYFSQPIFATGHIVYGIALGWLVQRRLNR